MLFFGLELPDTIVYKLQRLLLILILLSIYSCWHIERLANELFLPQKNDQLSVGVSGGVCTSGVRAPLKPDSQ